MNTPRRAHLAAGADAALVARHEGARLAALDAEARRLHKAWTTDRQRMGAHSAETARVQARLPVVRAAMIAAEVAGDATRAAELRAERGELEEWFSTSAEVAAGLKERAKASGLRWSDAYGAWRDAVAAELLGGFSAKREALDAAEAAARAELAAREREMPHR